MPLNRLGAAAVFADKAASVLKNPLTVQQTPFIRYTKRLPLN
jgi:hypothetical protein